MILARYLARDILLTTFAITLILILVVLSGRLSAYVADAATGRLAAELVFPILLARLPEYLELVIPLALFLGVLIALGRQQESNELVVMNACGVGPMNLLRVTLGCAFFAAAIIAMFSFFVTPRGGTYVNELIASQGLQSELGNVTPGRFYQLGKGAQTIYTRQLSDDRETMDQVFIIEPTEVGQRMMLASTGYQQVDANGGFYFVLENGVRYEGSPGRADFRISEFGTYAQLLDAPEPVERKLTDEQIQLLPELLRSSSPESRAELGWRLSLPTMVMLLAMLALPLSRSPPRQGWVMRLIPAVGLYLIYTLGLNVIRDEVRQGAGYGLQLYAGLHVAFLLLGILLLVWPQIRLRRVGSS